MKKNIKQSTVILALLTTQSAFSLDQLEAEKCLKNDKIYYEFQNHMYAAAVAKIFPEHKLLANIQAARDCEEYKDIIAVLSLGLKKRIMTID